MWAAAEVGELAGAVERNLFIGLGELLDEMALHEVAFFFEFLKTLLTGEELARIRLVALHQFLHFLLDLFQVFRSERSRTIKIVKEAGFSGRTMAELGLRKKFQYGGGEQVRGRMTKHFQRFR